MTSSELLNVYSHNVNGYKKVKYSYKRGERVAGIVHATGTGKSFIGLNLIYDNKDKKFLYVVPSKSIEEHVRKIISDNPRISFKNDFSNLEFITFHALVSLSEEELANLDFDYLIIDEFHHIGAPIWGARIKTLIKTHPNARIFGMTAYTIRDRGTPFERDMAGKDSDELFSGKIVSTYDLCDAIIDKVLPKPIYKTTHINLLDIAKELEEKVNKLDATTREYKEYKKIISHAKKRIHESPSIPTILKKNIKPNGKYIYFCPPSPVDGTNDIETIKKEALKWFKTFVSEENIEFYTTTSEMGKEGKLNREAFYNDFTIDGLDASNKLRVMFAINQYNEGVHAPNIDGVIMGRGTSSDIVFFEQLGRALAVRGNTKEMFEKLEKYEEGELKQMCRAREISFSEYSSKEELIEKLIAPVIIDLTNNYAFIKELETNLGNRIKEIKEASNIASHREIKLLDASFDIEIENADLYDMLKKLKSKLSIDWYDYFEYAKKYYEYHGNLEVPSNFKTNDGFSYDENGKVNLGNWIFSQRMTEKKGKLSLERKNMLLKINMRFGNVKSTLTWEENYEYAKKYYEYHGNLEVPSNFKTNDGFSCDENGKVNLGNWIFSQRIAEKKGKLSLERKNMLLKINMRFGNVKSTLTWEENYEYAKKYYEYHGNLEVPANFKTNDLFTYNENGKVDLGTWISKQRWAEKKGKLSLERKEKLLKINMRFNNIKSTLTWEENYEYAKKYYEYHGNLKVPQRFKTNDGFTYDENGKVNLGLWIKTQRQVEKKGKLPQDKKNLLSKIGMVWNVKTNKSEIIELCNKLNIDYKLNKDILEHVSIQELTAKINFLLDTGLPITNSNARLNRIFNLSNADMQREYGLSLEELIENYYLNKQNKI